MAVISGTLGSVVYNGTTGTIVAGMKNWSLDVSAAELDASSFGSTWKLTDSGIKEWGGSAEGNYDDGDAQQTAMWTALGAGTKVVMMFSLSPTDYFYGTVVFTGHSPSQSFDGLGAAAFNFKGHGPLTRV